MDKIYKYSDKYINRQKRQAIYLSAVCLVITIAVPLIVYRGLFLTIFSEIMFIFALYSFFSISMNLKKFEIHLTANGIETKEYRFYRMVMETFLYKDIKKIIIKSTKSGEPKSIQINLPKKSFLLSGFEDMTGFTAELKNKVSPDLIKQKTMILEIR